MSIDGRTAARAVKALGVLADLTPVASRRDASMSVPLEWFRWLDSGLSMLDSPWLPDPAATTGSGLFDVIAGGGRSAVQPSGFRLERRFGERLAAVQQVREGRQAIRIGWLWVAGTTTSVSSSGERVRRRVFHPLVTRTVRVVHPLRMSWELLPYGDPEITPLVTDRDEAIRLERHIEYGGGALGSFSELTPTLLNRLPRLKAFARECAAAAGLATEDFLIAREQPEELMRRDGLRLVVGLAVYATDEPGRTTRAGSLLAWPDSELAEPTAFHAVYAGLHAEPAGDRLPVEGPLPLTTSQAETVRMSREQLLTVVSGAPGTGKSHTLVTIVCDAVRRGESVLVAAKNDAAVDALIDLMDRQPGITPVVFGASERRSRLTQRLADGELRPADPEQLRLAAVALAHAIATRDEARAAVRRSLRPEWLRTPAGLAELEQSRRLAPAASGELFGDTSVLVAQCTSEGRGWLARRRRRRAERTLRRRAGAAPGTGLDALVAAIETTAAPRADGPTCTDACLQLHRREQEVRLRLAAWLALETRSYERLDRAGLAAVATLATALRSGRSARRVQLERLTDRALTRALPVWIGTLGDVDDLLPPVAGLFDLVLVDEASSTEQTIAASSLLRARRAVIVGDPRQLRHVSFLADATITGALERHGVDPADRSQLDVRRNSLFDAAAAACPVARLDEHFRSAPHLIDVVARSLYDGLLHVATRSPVSESIDCVHLQPTSGVREKGGVIRAEIEAVLASLRRRRSIDRSIGVITPFRAQADALEAAILASFSADDLVRMGVRVGTVHSFQGNERDAVICSLGLVDGDPGGWSFVADPHLLAVMLTRARRSMTLVSSCTPEPGSLLGQYVATADSPPGPPQPAAPLGTWAGSIAADLRLAGVELHEAYPCGRHIIDVAAVVAQRPIAIICDLHPDGIDAHVDRHLALLDQGWDVIEALASEWEDRQPELILDLTQRLRPFT